MRYIVSAFLFFVSYLATGQTAPMVNNIPWYEYSKKLSVGKLMIKNAGEYDTSFTIPSINAWITLDTIAADKTVTFAAGASTDAGVLCFVYNANSSAFTWNVSGSVIDASDGTSISTLGRGLHTFIWTGSRWARQSSGSGSGGTPDPYTGGYGILVDALTKVISLDSANLHQDLELKKLGDSMWFEVDGVAGTKVRVPDFSKTTTDSLLSTSLNSYWYYGGTGGLATSQEGTTANRPTLATDITRLRWNEDSSRFEVGDYTDGWRGLAYTNELGASGASDWNGLIESSRPFTTNETISGTYYNQYYFTGGSPSTLTLPSIASSANRTFFIKNQGSATLTVASAGAGEIFTTSLVSSFTMDVGAGYIVINDGDYWNVYAQGSGGGSGNTNSNIGSFYRLAVPNTNNIKTLAPGWGITNDSATNTNAITQKVDSATVLAAARNSLAAVARSGDYSDLTNPPSLQNPGVYFSPAQNSNPDFIVFASGIVRPTAAYSSGVAITWEFLEHGSLHNSSFFTYVRGNSSSKRLIIGYPKVKYVYNATVTPDESFAAGLVIRGPTVGTDSMQIQVNRNRQIGGVRLTGAGTSTWTKSGTDASSWNIDTHSGGGTSFTLTQSAGNVWGVSYEGINVQYVGSNNYHLRRVFSGLGSFNARFTIYDSTNTIVTSNPTSSDIILIGGTTGNTTQAVPMDVYLANVNDFMSTTTNFWVFGLFEAYMVAKTLSSSSVSVKWQAYAGASSYKIYRATDAAFTSPTLIYSGTGFSTTDTGLSSSTLYHYKMVAVISAVDTEITTFRSQTY